MICNDVFHLPMLPWGAQCHLARSSKAVAPPSGTAANGQVMHGTADSGQRRQRQRILWSTPRRATRRGLQENEKSLDVGPKWRVNIEHIYPDVHICKSLYVGRYEEHIGIVTIPYQKEPHVHGRSVALVGELQYTTNMRCASRRVSFAAIQSRIQIRKSWKSTEFTIYHP
jgi:hypothetical protein